MPFFRRAAAGSAPKKYTLEISSKLERLLGSYTAHAVSAIFFFQFPMLLHSLVPAAFCDVLVQKYLLSGTKVQMLTPEEQIFLWLLAFSAGWSSRLSTSMLSAGVSRQVSLNRALKGP